MKKKGRRQPFYPAPPFFKTFVPKSHIFKNSLPRASLFHRLFSDQESGNACRDCVQVCLEGITYPVIIEHHASVDRSINCLVSGYRAPLVE